MEGTNKLHYPTTSRILSFTLLEKGSTCVVGSGVRNSGGWLTRVHSYPCRVDSDMLWLRHLVCTAQWLQYISVFFFRFCFVLFLTKTKTFSSPTELLRLPNSLLAWSELSGLRKRRRHAGGWTLVLHSVVVSILGCQVTGKLPCCWIGWPLHTRWGGLCSTAAIVLLLREIWCLRWGVWY